VPAVPRRAARGAGPGGSMAALMDAGGEPWEPGDGERPACDARLASPDGDPRIRVMRGGVWW